MKTIHYAIGLPRSGSTVLMNIMQQNPEIFTSSTCPMPYMVDECSQAASSISEFIAMDQDVLNKSLTEFLKQGINGWFSGMTDKPTVISKSRTWDTHLNFLFHAYENPKFIVCLRDIRDVICSFEKLLHKNTFFTIGSREDPFHLQPFEKRMELYCTDIGANLGRPLHYMPHVYEWMQKRPMNFFLFRFEDFNQDPTRTLNLIYDWLEMPRFQHDLNNIEMAKQYEHDTVYRALVSHKTEPQLRKLEPSWPKMMTKEQSDLVIKHNEWFYSTFYPEIYNDYLTNRF